MIIQFSPKIKFIPESESEKSNYTCCCSVCGSVYTWASNTQYAKSMNLPGKVSMVNFCQDCHYKELNISDAIRVGTLSLNSLAKLVGTK